MSVGLCTAVIVCLSFVFSSHLRKTLFAEAERYLSETAGCLINSLNIQLKSRLRDLESIASSVAETNKFGISDMRVLQQKADVLDFIRISIVNPDGSSTASDGTAWNFSNNAEVIRAFSGECTVSNADPQYSKSENAFYYAVPVYENGAVNRILVSCSTGDQISAIADQEFFDGGVFFHTIERDGTIAILSSNENSRITGGNLFDFLAEQTNAGTDSLSVLRNRIAFGGSGFFYFTLKNSGGRFLYYAPLEYGNMYITVIATRESCGEQFDSLLREHIAVNIVLAFMFIFLTGVLFYSYHRSSRQLSDALFVDPITDGYARARFEIEAENLIRTSAPETWSFLTLDIVRFKLVNDAFGVKVGDKVLRYIHKIISSRLRGREIVCRFGSDHFDMLVETTDKQTIINRIEQISNEINSFNEDRQIKYFLTVSVGVYRIDDLNLSITHYRDRANVARREERQQNSSRNFLYTCMFYSDIERQKQQREKAMANRMHTALKEEEFLVYFQPKVCVKKNALCGAEALVRWEDSRRGIISPSEFIPLFEKNGFVVPLDLYVFEHTCRFLRECLDRKIQAVPVSVNLSRVHFNNVNFLEPFIAVREKYQIPAELIEIELTETVFLENSVRIAAVVNQLHDAGFRCSIDDFGAGYSSLNMLKDINVDTIKLDAGFFQSEQADNQRESMIIESVVFMAHRLGITIVAEGVKTAEQLAFLNEIECDMVQGYVFSKPISAQEFESMLIAAK